MHWIRLGHPRRFIAWIVYDGLKRTKDSHELDGYFLAKRSIPWWAAGISVMATQLSAITMIGTTGQGYTDGMRFIQFYFGLPLAMVILSVTLVPFFYNVRRLHRLRVPRAAVRREDAQLHQPAVPDVARHVVRRGRFGAGGRAVARARAGTSPRRRWLIALPAVRLHDVRRRAGGDLDRRQDHGAHRLRAVRGDRRGRRSACPTASASATGSASRRRPGGCARSTSVRPHQPVHVLVRHDRGAVPVLLVLRHRSEPGAALPDGASRSTRRGTRC